MKKILILALVMMATLIACNEDGSPLLSFLNTTQLPSQFYDININADTVLHTKNGGTITIKKGSIIAGSATTVKLEVKEAYSMEDIVKAGLLTQSNGKTLSSGGMIYLNVKDKDAKIVMPIKVSLPSNNIEENMQLFRGDTTADGKINWKDPQSLSANKTLDSIDQGKVIFINNCASCHNTIKDATGPALMFVTQRLSKEWMAHWIRNSSEMIASGDPYANCLYERYGKAAMTHFPNLSDAELDMMYKYLEQECKHYNPADFPNYKAAFDSCQAYNKAKMVLENKRDSFINDNGPEVENIVINPIYHDYTGPDNTVIPKSTTSIYYQFTITTFGWYNVDVFTMKIPGFEPSVMKAKVVGNQNGFTNIYLIIPEAKIFVAGGLLKRENDAYAFYTDDGDITLPQGKEAYIMAFTENDNKITFGITPFVTSRNNEINVTPQFITKEAMNEKIKSLNFKYLNINAHDSKNADSIRKIDIDLKNIESLKPKGADCNCGQSMNDTAESELNYK